MAAARIRWSAMTGFMGHHRDALKLNSEHTHGHVHTSRDECRRLGVLAVATQVLVMRCWRAGVRSKPPPGTLYHTGRQTPLTHAHAPAQIYSHSPLADLFASCYRGLGEPAEERGKGRGGMDTVTKIAAQTTQKGSPYVLPIGAAAA